MRRLIAIIIGAIVLIVIVIGTIIIAKESIKLNSRYDAAGELLNNTSGLYSQDWFDQNLNNN